MSLTTVRYEWGKGGGRTACLGCDDNDDADGLFPSTNTRSLGAARIAHGRQIIPAGLHKPAFRPWSSLRRLWPSALKLKIILGY